MSHRFHRTLLALIVGSSLWACGDNVGPECTVPPGVYPDWIGTVRCQADYELLWDDRSDSVFARTRTINWIIDREDDDRLYFIDTKEFELHYFFANAYLDFGEPYTPVGDHGEFNILNYRRDNRRFVMGKLMHYRDQGLKTLEFSAGDTASTDMIIDAYERVRDRLFDGELLVYRPVSADQEAKLPELEQVIPVVRTETVFAGQTFQPLNQTVGFGTLRFRRLAELGRESLAPTDIAVLDRVPNDIALVSGIVTEEFQTPLSHINVLSKNRGTPNMALRGAFREPELRRLEGKLVRLEVGPQDFTIQEATTEQAQAFWDRLRPSQPLIPVFDHSAIEPLDLDDLGADDGSLIGAKAANLAEVQSLRMPDGSPIVTPDSAFAVPFFFYHQHMTEHGLYDMADAIVAEVETLSPEQLAERLFELRWTLYRAPINEDALAQIDAEARARFGDQGRVRFRSSTNVEDLEEFSGAGLYTSAGADLEQGDTSVANAVKTVWASTWNYQAFVERQFYRVDQSRVRMAVLVHPSVPEELANGVAVTINEFAANRPAFYLNSQIGEVSVTNPTGLAVPEQILYYTWYEEPEYEVITRSSLVDEYPGWPAAPSVFTDAELDHLADYLTVIHNHFKARNQGTSQFAMDVEYKLLPGRVVLIKQARPIKGN